MAVDFLTVLRAHAEAHGDVIAIASDGSSLDYRTLDQRTDSFASALRSAGIARGDRVSLMAKSCVEFLEFLIGSMKAGVVPVPVNWRLANAEIEAIIDDAEVVLLVVAGEFSERAEAMEGRLARVHRIVSLERHGRYPKWADWLDAHADDARKPAQLAADAVIMQMYTSGTTGGPKGSMISNGGFASYLESLSSIVHLTLGSVSLSTLPLFHIGGAGWAFGGLYRGATVVVLRDVDPELILDTVVARRVTHAIAVPSVVQMLLQSSHLPTTDFSSLRYLYYGAGPMPEYILRNALDAFGCEFVQGYGMTECPLICALEPKDHAPGLGLLRSCGRPIPGTTVRIVDPETCSDVVPGSVGEIWVNSPQGFAGYWKQPEVSRRTLVDGAWLRTGDGACANADGYLFMQDRLKDMIVSGGENVHSIEVENALISHLDVAECAVIGVPSEKWIETVKAIVVRVPGSTITGEQLIAYCKSQLAGYKCPTSVEFVDSLPKTPSGKVVKYLLRQRYANLAAGTQNP